MKILHTLPTVKVPKTAIVAAGITILLAVFIIGIALYERQARIEAAQHAAEIKTRTDKQDAVIARLQALENAGASKDKRLATVCDYVAGLAKNKTVRPPVVVPPACK